MESLILGPRTVDELGRVVLPKEVRALLGIASSDVVQFVIRGGTVEIRKVRRLEVVRPGWGKKKG